VYLFVSGVLVKFKIDDPLDAVAVHAGAGLWGIIAVAIFKFDGVLATGSEQAFQVGFRATLKDCQTQFLRLFFGTHTLGLPGSRAVFFPTNLL
jgi:ammonia channel protein AmtB